MSSSEKSPFDPTSPSSTSPASNEDAKAQPPVDTDTDTDTDSTESSIPPRLTPPLFIFRTNSRNIYINPLTNLTSTPSPNESNHKPEEPPKWDEMCLQWCKQKDKNRGQGINPT
ncbi:17999_t:CDS:1, partial [Acaulospora morrowiae]